MTTIFPSSKVYFLFNEVRGAEYLKEVVPQLSAIKRKKVVFERLLRKFMKTKTYKEKNEIIAWSSVLNVVKYLYKTLYFLQDFSVRILCVSSFEIIRLAATSFNLIYIV